MAKPRVILDCDGVLADFIGGVCETLAEKGHIRTPDDIKTFDIEAHLSLEEIEIFRKVFAQCGWCRHLSWYPHALNYAKELNSIADVIVATAPGASVTWCHERAEWLSQIFEPRQVVFCHSSFKKYLEADFIIEDNAATAKEWSYSQPGKALIVDRPWNRDVPLPFGISRVTFKDAVNFIKTQC